MNILILCRIVLERGTIMDHREGLIQEYERTLHFQFFFGGRTLYKHPYVRRWRALPFMLVARATRNPFRLDFQGGESYTLVPGQVMVVPSGVTHRVASVKNGKVLDHWAMVRYAILGTLEVTDVQHISPVLPTRMGRAIEPLLDEIIENDAGQASLTLTARRLTSGFQLLQILLEGADPRIRFEQVRGLHRLLPVLRYIQHRLSEPISRAELAAQVHLSESRFHDVFRHTFGMAPLKYLQRVRLQKAQRMLVDTSAAIAEICEEVGFGDQFHFSRLFKSRFGVSPSAYRKMR